MNSNERQLTAEQIWLHYFNRYLFEHGLITEAEKNRMALRIDNRKAHASIKGKARGSPE